MSDPAAITPDSRAIAVVGPWSGFELASNAAVTDLHRRLGLDLWMITQVVDDQQLVIASAGPWSGLAPPGAVFSWPASFCLRMVRDGNPVAEPDVHGSPVYADIAVGDLANVRAYVGVPLLSSEGRLFGTLCAFAGQPQPAAMPDLLEPVLLLGRMLSTILAGEQIAADRSDDAATANALAERDLLTGLTNRRGWEAALRLEEQRALQYGHAVSVVAVDLDGLKQINDARGHASGDALLLTCGAVMRNVCRPGDALSRMGGDEFGVLAVECDAMSARALTVRLSVQLRALDVAASLGYATRRPHESINLTWQRADEAMYRNKRRRRRRHSPVAAARRAAT